MDAFKEALIKKMQAMKGMGDGEGELKLELEGGEEDEESSELAPKLEAGKEQQMLEGDSEMDPEMMKILEALSDRAAMGRPAGSLGERAATGAKDKLTQLKGMKK